MMNGTWIRESVFGSLFLVVYEERGFLVGGAIVPS